MESDLPWPTPGPYVVVGRRWKYAPPPWVIFDSVVEDMSRWLSPAPGEVKPKVAASRRPNAVLLRPWLDEQIRAVELHIQPDGQGTSMRVLAYGDVPQLDDDQRRLVRHRLGTVFGEALRNRVDH